MTRQMADPRFSRNFGFWSEDEQEALTRARVAIAGVGGDGFQLGLKLARMGVSSFAIADPEKFEPENANRVEGAGERSYGREKTDVFAERLLDINADAKITLFTDGVTEDNVGDFMADAALVFDESELTRPEIGTLIARQARAQGIPDVLVMNVGFAAQVTSFAPESPWTFERFMGLDPRAPIEDIRGAEVDLSRCVPYVPPYLDLRSLLSVQSGVQADGKPVPLPSISVGVDLASAMGSAQAFLHLTAGVSRNRPRPLYAPKVAYLDAYRMRARIVRAGRPSHQRHLLRAALRQRLGRNPLGSYTVEDIARRS